MGRFQKPCVKQTPLYRAGHSFKTELNRPPWLPRSHKNNKPHACPSGKTTTICIRSKVRTLSQLKEGCSLPCALPLNLGATHHNLLEGMNLSVSTSWYGNHTFLVMADPSFSGQSGNAGGMQEITLAVLGAAKTGKSTFVQCALDLKKPAVSAASTKRVSLEGATSVLRLIELPIHEVGMTINQEIGWPERVGDQAMPRIDGALVLYDVTNQGSIAQVPSMLGEFIKLGSFYSFRYSNVEE
jgi:hypothetical protein